MSEFSFPNLDVNVPVLKKPGNCEGKGEGVEVAPFAKRKY